MSEYTPPPPSAAPPPPPPPVGGGGGGEVIPPPPDAKDPVLILILNLIVAGCLGYFMMGQKMKGIVALIVWIVCIPLTCGIVSGLVSVVAAIDGYLQAQHHKAGYSLGPWTFFNQHL
jgi:TM2 domain-containing membrane protein YozV